MSITTLVFLAFVGIACLIYYLVPKKGQWIVLLTASLLFFISNSALLSIYMLLTTALVYIGARLVQKRKDEFAEKKKELPKSERKAFKASMKKKQKVIVAVFSIAVLAILVALKYCNFLGDIINFFPKLIASKSIIPRFEILLPLGISYYTLMAVSYIVDVHRGIIDAEKNPFRVLLFVCYFPHIIEGPFDRYKDLDEQFRTPHKFDYDGFRGGFLLILFGFFKKLVIADRIGQFVPDIFNNADNYSGTAIIIGTILYTIQLYMDFSGCIDIISGVSELFGIKVAENFRQPFFAKSINEFWRRWHISLGTWLKEYVFYPVTLSGHFKKVNQFATKRIKSAHLASFVPLAYSLFFVWFCNGLWHGASLKYIVYGLYYYVLMMIGELCKPFLEKLMTKLHINRENKIFIGWQMLRTFIIVNVGMLIFRSASLADSCGFIYKMVSSINIREILIAIPNKGDLALVVLGLIIVIAVGVMKEKGINIRLWLNNHVFIISWIVYLFLIFATIITGIYGVEYGEGAAIYAQF